MLINYIHYQLFEKTEEGFPIKIKKKCIEQLFFRELKKYDFCLFSRAFLINQKNNFNEIL